MPRLTNNATIDEIEELQEENEEIEEEDPLKNLLSEKQKATHKDVVVRVLVQCFASMVEASPREDATPDFRGRYNANDMVFKKLLDASKHVIKARQ
jgi:hypothetical protein